MYRYYLSNEEVVESTSLRAIYYQAISDIIYGAHSGENLQIEIINVDTGKIAMVLDCIYFESYNKGYIFAERGWRATFPRLVRVFRGGLSYEKS